MKKTKLKTKKTRKSVSAFLSTVTNPKKRKDAKMVNSIMREVTGEKPVMWGDSIVGFGEYHYKYESGREGDWMITGFSPRANSLTVYIMHGYSIPKYKEILKKLGPHTLGRSCLYIKDLDDIHIPSLKKLIKLGYKDMKKKYG